MTTDKNATLVSHETDIEGEGDLKIRFRKLDEQNENTFSKNYITLSESALYWASMTVGAPSLAAAMQNYSDAPAFALHKWSAICSVACIRDSQIHLRKSYHMLDPTEKGVLSYWAGMIFAKLVAEKILHTPWAAHARILQKNGFMQVDPPKTNSLPDLVCYEGDSEIYHIVEAKGRCKQNFAQIEKYKEQTRRIAFINGKEPTSRNVCVTYLKSPFAIDLFDPETDPEKKAVVEINLSVLQKYYYMPLVAFLTEKGYESDECTSDPFIYRQFACDHVDKRKFRIGMVKDMFEQVTNEEFIERGKSLEQADVSKLRKDPFFSNTDFFIGLDGIFVQLF